MRSVDADVGEGHRRDREDRDAVAADQERVFVSAVDAAPVLDDPQPPGRDLVRDPVVEGDDTVRDILFEPVLGDGPVPALARDNGGDAPVLEPEEEPAQLRPEDGLVREAGEDGLEGIDGDTLCADLVDHRAEPDK